MRHSGVSVDAPASRGAPKSNAKRNRGEECDDHVFQLQLLHADANIDRTGAGAVAGGIAALGLGTIGAPVVRAQAAKTKIDVHHHFLPPVHREALSEHKTGAPKWSVQMSLDDMDKSGIGTSVLSQVQPGTWWGDNAESRRLSREINEYGAKIVRDHPGRFGLFATITPADPDGALKEIEYAFDTLKADGIGLLTSYNGKYLGDASFDPVYAELNRRKAVIYVHPLAPNCCGDVVPGMPPGSIEYATDSTRTIAHLVFSGSSQKHPDIRWIFSHAAVPYRALHPAAEGAEAPSPAEWPDAGVSEVLL
jgi:predicted TIM-barrel fold metal-dependent hydrolase